MDEEINTWLDPANTRVTQLLPLLKTYNRTEMNLYPVTPMVANDEHDCYECGRDGAEAGVCAELLRKDQGVLRISDEEAAYMFLVDVFGF